MTPNPNQALMNRRTDKRLIDEAFHAYVEWLDESDAVWDAYDRWVGAAHSDAALMTQIPSGAQIAAEFVRPHRSASKVPDPWRP